MVIEDYKYCKHVNSPQINLYIQCSSLEEFLQIVLFKPRSHYHIKKPYNELA